MGDPEIVNACPECDRAGKMRQRAGRGNAVLGNPEDDWVCRNCGATFDEPEEREADYGTAGINLNVDEELLESVRESLAMEDD